MFMFMIANSKRPRITINIIFIFFPLKNIYLTCDFLILIEYDDLVC